MRSIVGAPLGAPEPVSADPSAAAAAAGGGPFQRRSSTPTGGRAASPIPSTSAVAQQPTSQPQPPPLARWRETAAIMAANRSAGDATTLVALGDRLWAEMGDACGAHLCYALAGLAPQAFHPGARVVLLGANHKGCPRTYANPAAIQRTEVWEYGLRLVREQGKKPPTIHLSFLAPGFSCVDFLQVPLAAHHTSLVRGCADS